MKKYRLAFKGLGEQGIQIVEADGFEVYHGSLSFYKLQIKDPKNKKSEIRSIETSAYKDWISVEEIKDG